VHTSGAQFGQRSAILGPPLAIQRRRVGGPDLAQVTARRQRVRGRLGIGEERGHGDFGTRRRVHHQCAAGEHGVVRVSGYHYERDPFYDIL
jgi:hypothetical protein